MLVSPGKMQEGEDRMKEGQQRRRRTGGGGGGGGEVMGTNQGGTLGLNLAKEDVCVCVCVCVRRLAESAAVPVSRLRV